MGVKSKVRFFSTPRPKPPPQRPTGGPARDRTDPLPAPPVGDPREGMPLGNASHSPQISLREQTYFVAPGEFLRLRLKDLLTDPRVTVYYPSGAESRHRYDGLERFLNLQGLTGKSADILQRLLVNYKDVAWWPHENIQRICLRTATGGIWYV